MSKPTLFCAKLMSSGKTCGVPASRGSKFCHHHDPDRRERKPLRHFASGIEPLDSLGSMHRLIHDTVRQLVQGRIDSRRARAVLAAIRDSISIAETMMQGLRIL